MRYLPVMLLLLITAACSTSAISTASTTLPPTQVVNRPAAPATAELTLTHTPTLMPSATPTDTPSPTMTATPTPAPSETATATTTPTATPKPTKAATQQPKSTSTQPPLPTATLPTPASHVGSGQYDGCPFLFEGQYVTQPRSGGSPMDLVYWALGQPVAHLRSVSRSANGEVLAVLESGETVNLNAVDHREVTVLNVPLAIETRGDGISWQEVSSDTLYEILIPGVPLYYGNPGWGSTFKVVVGCNQP